MKKNSLTNAVIAAIAGVTGIASVANAVNINPDGLGQVLIYPYYTVNGGNQTLLSVVNTTDAGKAVKVRFLEGRNSREVLDFNLYLSPYDVWTASVFSLSDAAGQSGNLVTDDNSCTAPRIKGNTQLPTLPSGARYAPFFNYQYIGTNNDSGPDNLDRTREGHFEMIEMGEVVDLVEDSLTNITHDATGFPEDCAAIVAAWTPAGYWTADPTIDIVPPGGGLFGAAAVVDAVEGTMLSYNADAIDAFRNDDFHTNPGSLFPNLANAQTLPGEATAYIFDNAAVATSTYNGLVPVGDPVDAVSAVLAHDAMFNEFSTTDALSADSEWVVTFPTKWAYVDQNLAAGAFATPPFPRVFPRTGATGTAPIDIALRVFDREEGPSASVCDGDACVPFSPLPPEQTVDTPQVLWETNVITFNQPDVAVVGSSILGSRLTANVDTEALGVQEGWMRMGLYDATALPPSRLDTHIMRQDTAGRQWLGLPATGFWAWRIINEDVGGGILANYSGLFKHRASRASQFVVVP